MKLIDKVSNFICVFIAAWVVAMICVEFGNYQKPTHSGTQSYVK